MSKKIIFNYQLWFSIVNHDKSGNTYCRWTYWNVVNDAATCTIKKLYINTHWTMSRRSFSNINFAITLLHLWFSILNHNKPGDTYFRWTYLNAVDDTYCNLDHEEIIHQYTLNNVKKIISKYQFCDYIALFVI